MAGGNVTHGDAVEIRMTNESRREPSRKDVRDMINVICAAIIFVSPWALGFAAETRAAWTAWSGGVVIGAMAIAALLEFAEWEEWVALLVGAAVAASPWVLGFATISPRGDRIRGARNRSRAVLDFRNLDCSLPFRRCG